MAGEKAIICHVEHKVGSLVLLALCYFLSIKCAGITNSALAAVDVTSWKRSLQGICLGLHVNHTFLLHLHLWEIPLPFLLLGETAWLFGSEWRRRWLSHGSNHC